MPSSAHKSATFVSFCPMAAMAKRTFAAVILKGAPPFRPRARAEASPALVRSEIRSRSNCERSEDAKHELPRRRRGVDRRAVAGEHLETDVARAEVVNGIDEVAQVAAQPIELPNDQGVPTAQGLEGGIESRPRIEAAGGAVLVEPARGNSGGPKSVALQIGALRSVRLRH